MLRTSTEDTAAPRSGSPPCACLPVSSRCRPRNYEIFSLPVGPRNDTRMGGDTHESGERKLTNEAKRLLKIKEIVLSQIAMPRGL